MTESDIQIIIDNLMGSFMYGYCLGYALALFKALAALVVNFK